MNVGQADCRSGTAEQKNALLLASTVTKTCLSHSHTPRMSQRERERWKRDIRNKDGEQVHGKGGDEASHGETGLKMDTEEYEGSESESRKTQKSER